MKPSPMSCALEALQTEGLAGPIGPYLQVEYPVASAWESGQLLVGVYRSDRRDGRAPPCHRL